MSTNSYILLIKEKGKQINELMSKVTFLFAEIEKLKEENCLLKL